jgi:hypothetical protein
MATVTIASKSKVVRVTGSAALMYITDKVNTAVLLEGKNKVDSVIPIDKYVYIGIVSTLPECGCGKRCEYSEGRKQILDAFQESIGDTLIVQPIHISAFFDEMLIETARLVNEDFHLEDARYIVGEYWHENFKIPR